MRIHALMFLFVMPLSLNTYECKIKYEKKDLQVNFPSDLVVYLKSKKVKYPKDWLKVSKLEAGHNWESYLATKHHNYFGFNACYFKNKTQCANYLIYWISLDPFKEGETFNDYLVRRKYNPNMANYLKLLNNVR